MKHKVSVVACAVLGSIASAVFAVSADDAAAAAPADPAAQAAPAAPADAAAQAAPAATAAPVNTVAQNVSKGPTLLPFRHGKIYSAEIYTAAPDFLSQNPADPPKGAPEPGAVNEDGTPLPGPKWCELVVTLSYGRSLSRFDYVLVGPKGEYPCYGVTIANEAYNMDKSGWVVQNVNERTYVRMLFPIPNEDLTDEPIQNFKLKFVLRDTKLKEIELPVRLLPEGSARTDLRLIPNTGNVGKTFEELKR